MSAISIEARQTLDAAETMYRALGHMPCVCERLFLYHGPIAKPCSRCLSMALWEDLMGTSGIEGSRRKHLASVKV